MAELERLLARPAAAGVFTEEQLDGLPGPVARTSPAAPRTTPTSRPAIPTRMSTWPSGSPWTTSAGRVGWFYGTARGADGEFFRYEITELRLVTPRS